MEAAATSIIFSSPVSLSNAAAVASLASMVVVAAAEDFSLYCSRSIASSMTNDDTIGEENMVLRLPMKVLQTAA